jgi:hypothetical protein
MKRFYIFSLFMAVVLVTGLLFTACGGGDDGGEKYDPVVYTSKDTAGNTYKLTITKNTGKAAFTPGTGDSYSRTITYADGTTKTSTGTLKSYSATEISFENATGVSFTITLTGSGTMTKIEGTIPIDGGGTVTAPGTVTPQDNNPPPPPPANPFANTTWKGEMQVTEGGVTYNVVGTISFGTITYTIESKTTPPYPDMDMSISGTYTASGNTAAMTHIGEGGGPVKLTATISGNVLTVINSNDNIPMICTRVN